MVAPSTEMSGRTPRQLVTKASEAEDLRDDLTIDTAGIVTFLGDASTDGAMLFV